MNENLKGIFSALSPARRSFINERLLAKAASDDKAAGIIQAHCWHACGLAVFNELNGNKKGEG